MIDRTLANNVNLALETQAAVVLLGPRQVGKTTLAFEIAQQRNATYLDMERRSDRQILADPDLYLDQGSARARVRRLSVQRDEENWYQFHDEADILLSELDTIFMRKDPPVDSEFVYATHILEVAEKEGSLVVNRPQSLRDCNEKLFATQFPQCCPPVLVS